MFKQCANAVYDRTVCDFSHEDLHSAYFIQLMMSDANKAYNVTHVTQTHTVYDMKHTKRFAMSIKYIQLMTLATHKAYNVTQIHTAYDVEHA